MDSYFVVSHSKNSLSSDPRCDDVMDVQSSGLKKHMQTRHSSEPVTQASPHLRVGTAWAVCLNFEFYVSIAIFSKRQFWPGTATSGKPLDLVCCGSKHQVDVTMAFVPSLKFQYACVYA